eukprot:scaffold17798_cov55-Phaeocystis_antarctica.AAC.1
MCLGRLQQEGASEICTQAGLDREHRHDQLGHVAEGGVEQPAQPGEGKQGGSLRYTGLQPGTLRAAEARTAQPAWELSLGALAHAERQPELGVPDPGGRDGALWRAQSGAFALPRRVSFVCSASCSVTKERRSAKGAMARSEKANITPSDPCWRASTANGVQSISRFRHRPSDRRCTRGGCPACHARPSCPHDPCYQGAVPCRAALCAAKNGGCKSLQTCASLLHFISPVLAQHSGMKLSRSLRAMPRTWSGPPAE